MKTIPLHSLVLMVGPSGAGKSTFCRNYFDEHEIISIDDVRQDLVGDFIRRDINHIAWPEVYRRAAVKLSLGQRVIIDGTHLRSKDRLQSAKLGLDVGVPIFYIIVNRPLEYKLNDQGWRLKIPNLVEKHDEIFTSNEKYILKGDGVAEIIDSRIENINVIKDMPYRDIRSDILNKGFNGVTVVGDIHGSRESLLSVIDWATSRGNWLLFLGDITDYGPYSLECIDIIYRLVIRGRAGFTIGNHDKKLEKWIIQNKQGNIRIKLTDGNKVTIDQISALSKEDRQRFELKFNTLFSKGRHHWVIGNTVFTHAAMEPEMFNVFDRRLIGDLENRAVYGELDEDKKFLDNGYPNRVYNWVERIPRNHRSIVGHDIRSINKPFIVGNSNGGEAIFMDTGCSKGGRLSSADLNISNHNVKLINFNMF